MPITVFLMAPSQGGANPMMNLLFFGAIIFILYFFMIRPQTKKAKEQRKFIDAIEKGDNIVTMGGVHGKIVRMDEGTLTIETEGGGKLKLERSAISLENTKVRYPKEQKVS